MPLDDKNKDILQKAISENPLGMIEYWSVDFDYDERQFFSRWQCYRDKEFKISHKAEITIPKIQGRRKICVKAVDVFGFESQVICEI